METEQTELNANSTSENTEVLNENTNSTENKMEESPLEKLTKEKAELQDKYLRMFAEFENFKKRNAKERLELMMTANKETITALLDVVDDCERATKQFEKESEIKNVVQGANLVFGKFKKILESKGLKKMETLNANFDIEKHEAITELEVAEDKKGKVIDVVQDGYLLNDKIVRFAKVVVGK